MPGNVAAAADSERIMGNNNGAPSARVKFGGGGGLAGGKISWRKRHKSPEKDATATVKVEEEGEFAEARDDNERDELWRMRKMIREEPNVFLMSNLLLSIQLFANYEKEMKEAHQEVQAREDKLNEKLLPEKVALMPDALREHFAGRLRFTSLGKSDQDEQTVEPLRPIQIFLVYENVVVTELDESRHYSTPGELSLNYTFVLKKANHEGYVRLEQISKPSLKRGPGSDNTDLSSIAENLDEIYSEDESVYGPLANGSQQNGVSSAGAAVGGAKKKTASMPDLLDEDLYYDEQNSNSTQDLQNNGTADSSPLGSNSRIAGVPNVRIPSRLTRQHRGARSRSSHLAVKPSSASSSSSGYTTNYALDSDSSDYSATSQHQFRPQQQQQRQFHRPCRDASAIPSRCFKRVTYMYDGRVYEPRKDQKPLNSQQRRIRDLKLLHNKDVIYVSGSRFAKHFCDLFKGGLAERMDFDEKAVKNATRSDAVIKLEKIDYVSSKNCASIEQYEVIPCFSSPWPKWAREWQMRARSVWPNPEDVRHVEKCLCYLTPESWFRLGLPDRYRRGHPLWKLDWNLSFPTAERYLETCLSAAQTTVYAIALMLHKTFMRSVSSSFGLSTGHIRNMLFWMVERQPHWSEHEMGKSMLILLETLHARIQQRTMYDYFLPERNVFANVHTDDLLHSQKQLKRIVENPVMFLFHAMEKIHYERDDYYPRLDYRELLRLLTINELLLINPNLEAKNQEDQQPQQQDIGVGLTAAYGKREAEKKFWSEAKQTNQYYQQTRKRSMNTLINPKLFVDSIADIQEKCEPLTNARLSRLLIFFSDHFLLMARSCLKQGAARQNVVYLDQARLLALLLHAESPDHKSQARRILDEVREQRDSPLRKPGSAKVQPVPPQGASNRAGPETPRRNVDAPIYARTLKDRFSGDGQDIGLGEQAANSHPATVQAEVHVHAVEGKPDASGPRSALYKATSKIGTTRLAKKLMASATIAEKSSAETTIL